jgi:hypothetical protein
MCKKLHNLSHFLCHFCEYGVRTRLTLKNAKPVHRAMGEVRIRELGRPELDDGGCSGYT